MGNEHLILAQSYDSSTLMHQCTLYCFEFESNSPTLSLFVKSFKAGMYDEIDAHPKASCYAKHVLLIFVLMSCFVSFKRDGLGSCWVSPSCLTHLLPPHHDHVLTANNDATHVTGASSVLLTPALPLDKVLLMTWQLVEFFVLVAPKLLSITGFGCYIADLIMHPLDIYNIYSLHYLMVSTTLLSNVRLVFSLRVIWYPTLRVNEVAKRKNGEIIPATHALLLGASVLKRGTGIGWFDTRGDPAEPAEHATPVEPTILIDAAAVTKLIAPPP
ncbi:unnamed protein product [Prunus armeniaca]